MTTPKALQTLHLLDVATFLRIVQWNTRKGIRRFARLVSCSADGWLYPAAPALAALFSVSLAVQLLIVLTVGFTIEREKQLQTEPAAPGHSRLPECDYGIG